MWEMFIVVFVHKNEAHFVTNVQGKYYATGVMNYVGNKGGLLLQFNFFERTFSVINCHLPSGVDKAEKRMDHLANILRNIGCSKTAADRIEPDAIADFSVILGDLNSRFMSTYSKHIDNVKKSREMIKSLDELHDSMQNKQSCFGYHEETIHFDPTYKRSALENSTYINKKDQCPSYTDRIIVKAAKEAFVTQYNSYGSND
jgi:phosphatidylinositol-3,4,5-trisphosphate 5-phosphatase 2